MGEILQLDYYYGIEAEQFSFYRVPRLLILMRETAISKQQSAIFHCRRNGKSIK